MKATKIFFDTEFTGLHQNTTLISIGLVSETGREFYAEFSDYDREQVDPWVQANVIQRLLSSRPGLISHPKEWEVVEKLTFLLIDFERLDVVDYLKQWFTSILEQTDSDRLEMWSDCLAYDWILFCELFGGARQLPDYVYYIPFDLATLFLAKGIDPDITRHEFMSGYNVYEVSQVSEELWGADLAHISLFDARIIWACYHKLMEVR